MTAEAIPSRYHDRMSWPLARLGYWYATAVGFAWGALLSTGRIRRHHGMWVFTGLPRWAFKRGGVCIGACYLTDRNTSPAVMLKRAASPESMKT